MITDQHTKTMQKESNIHRGNELAIYGAQQEIISQGLKGLIRDKNDDIEPESYIEYGFLGGAKPADESLMYEIFSDKEVFAKIRKELGETWEEQLQEIEREGGLFPLICSVIRKLILNTTTS